MSNVSSSLVGILVNAVALLGRNSSGGVTIVRQKKERWWKLKMKRDTKRDVKRTPAV